MIEWETGEIYRETLTIIAPDDPGTRAIYAKNAFFRNKTVEK